MEEWHYSNALHTWVGHMLSTCTNTKSNCKPQMSGKGRRHVAMETSRNWLQKSIGLQGEAKHGPIRGRLLWAQVWKLSAHANTDNHMTPCNIIPVNIQRQWLTNELLVPNVQSHVPQSCGHGTNHPVIVYPQQLHQDRKTLLFTNCSADIDGPLDRAEGFYSFLVHFKLLMILDSYWCVMGSCKDCLVLAPTLF